MRAILLTLLIVNGLLLPLGCVPALFAFNAVNPMAVAFITDIHITNALDVPITITPVGTVDPQGKRALLPTYALRFPVVPALRAGGFTVEPGETLDLLYDWDDINLSEIVIGFADGTTRQLIVDREPTKNQFRQPAINVFTIRDPALLEPVPADVAAAAERVQRIQRPWPLIVLGIVPWLTFFRLLRAYRRRVAAPAAAEHAHRTLD